MKFFDDYEEEQNKLDKAAKGKVYWAMRMKDQELDAERYYNKNNTCPNCHLVLPLSGICDDCGFIKKKK